MNRTIDLTVLNPEQREAVEHISGPTLVLAGAGSGKTRVLTYKIAYLVSRGIKPWRILAVTFTNKAAREMIERVERLLHMPAKNLWLGTFHGICVRILRREADRWGFPRDFTIYDRNDQIAVVKKAAGDIGKKCEGSFAPGKVLQIIGRAKNDGIPPERLDETIIGADATVYEELYRRYNTLLRDSGAFDFDDLLLKPVEMFSADRESLKKWQNRFSYILVDEYQDTNRVQYRLMKLLCGDSGNITVVGDDDQSIYGWRGANIRNILDFEGEFDKVKTVHLEQNYRSTGNILDAANTVIANNKARTSKRLWTSLPEGDRVTVFECFDEHEEAGRIVSEIEHEREDKDLGLGDFAILYRTNAQSRVFEEVFMRNGMPYAIVGGVRFYERKEIKDILSYLRLTANPNDSVSFERAVSAPRRGIGEKTIESIERFSEKNRISILESLARASEFLGRKMAGKVKTFHEIMKAVAGMRGNAGLDEIAQEVVFRIGYEKYLEDNFTDNAKDRIENVNELITAMGDFVNETEEDDLSSFLAEVSLVSDVDTWDDSKEAVTLMTLHSAKGLEFPSVFVTGVEDELFPLSRSLETEAELEEERRLFYVGITRAMRRLHISYACCRSRYGSFGGGASLFMDELPGEAVEFEVPEPEHAGYFRRASSKNAGKVTFEDYSQEAPEFEGNGFFSVGAFIRHPKFGRGRITEVSGTGDALMLTILFGAKKKKIMAKYANLTPA